MGTVSCFWTSTVSHPVRDQAHALLDIERRAHAGQRQSELDERDRDRRPHADDHRLCIQHARHRRDVRQHAPDERVDQRERRDVEDDAVHRDPSDKRQLDAVAPGRGAGATRPAIGIAERDRRGPHRRDRVIGMAIADADIGRQFTRLHDLCRQAHRAFGSTS